MRSADEMGKGGTRYYLPGPGCLEGVPGPEYVLYVFVFLGSIFVDCTN
jgi:hypothetical protein